MSHSDKEVAKEKVNDVALRLQEIERESGWSRTISIGRLILDSFFLGDPASWHVRRGKDNSLRQLAAHPLCPLKKSSIAEAVGVYIITLEDPDICKTALTPSHVKCVLQLGSQARQDLLKQASEEKLSVRALAERAHLLKNRGVPHKRLQPSGPHKVLDRLQTACENVRRVRASVESVLWAAPEINTRLVEALRILDEEIAAARKAIFSAGRPVRLPPSEVGSRTYRHDAW